MLGAFLDQRDPYGDTEKLLDAGRDDWRVDCIDRVLSDARCLVFAGDVARKQRKLVAADPCRQHPLAADGPQPLRDCLQGLVARGVAEDVVDLLETVKVEQEHGAASVVALDCRQRLVKAAPVRQTGQLVLLGERESMPLGGEPQRKPAALVLDSPDAEGDEGEACDRQRDRQLVDLGAFVMPAKVIEPLEEIHVERHGAHGDGEAEDREQVDDDATSGPRLQPVSDPNDAWQHGSSGCTGFIFGRHTQSFR